VRVLPPEQALEAFEADVREYFLELRRGLVLGEQRFPIRLRQRRQRAGERFGEARDAADHHHGESEGGANEQP